MPHIDVAWMGWTRSMMAMSSVQLRLLMSKMIVDYHSSGQHVPVIYNAWMISPVASSIMEMFEIILNGHDPFLYHFVWGTSLPLNPSWNVKYVISHQCAFLCEMLA